MKKQPSFTEAITESIFVILPFIVLLIIKLMKNDLTGFIQTSDYSLATSILYGQLLAKTLTIPDVTKNTESFKLFQVVIFCISIISIVMYAGFQLLDQISSYVYWVQFVVFILAVIVFIPIYSLMKNMTK